MNPKISVILSVYNGEKYLKEAIESILRQTFTDFELIIINDGSTDGTSSVIESFSDGRIIKITNERNLGLIASLNKGIKEAKGEFLARMDADDVSLPERFDRQIKFLEAHPEVGVLGTAMEQMSAQGRNISIFKPATSHWEIIKNMLYGTAVAHATVVMRRDIFNNETAYDPLYPHTEDTELWTRLIFKTQFANLPEVLYKRRLHKNSIMGKFGNFQERQDIKIKKKLANILIQQKVLSREEAEYLLVQHKKQNQFFLAVKNLIPFYFRHKLKSFLYNLWRSFSS